MELMIAIIVLFITALCYKFRSTITEWLKDPHALGDMRSYEVKTLLKYGIDDAGERIRDLRLKEKAAKKMAKSNGETPSED